MTWGRNRAAQSVVLALCIGLATNAGIAQAQSKGFRVRGANEAGTPSHYGLVNAEPAGGAFLPKESVTLSPLARNPELIDSIGYHVLARAALDGSSARKEGDEANAAQDLLGRPGEPTVLSMMAAVMMGEANRNSKDDAQRPIRMPGSEDGSYYKSGMPSMLIGPEGAFGAVQVTDGPEGVAMVTMFMPTNVLMGMTRFTTGLPKRPGAAGAQNGGANFLLPGGGRKRGASGRGGSGAEGEASVSFGIITLDGEDIDRNVFIVNEADLSGANGVRIQAPAGSEVTVNVNGANGSGQSQPISFTMPERPFIASASGSLAYLNGLGGTSGFGNAWLMTFSTSNFTTYNGFPGGTGFPGMGGGFGARPASIVPEQKSVVLFCFGLLALLPAARRLRRA